MGDLVNLRQARKRKLRDQKTRLAEQNRALHGRSRHERILSDQQRQNADKQHDGHKRTDGDANGDSSDVFAIRPGAAANSATSKTGKKTAVETSRDEKNVISVFSPERPEHE